MRLRVMADYDCWPLWNDDDPDNVDPETLPISAALRTRLARWQGRFDDTLDRADPARSPGFASDDAEAAFEAEGRQLADELRRELGPGTPVRYWRDSWEDTVSSPGIYDADHPVPGLPNPGSDDAIAAGCTCPSIDNQHGRLVGGMGFYIAASCRLHGPEAPRAPRPPMEGAALAARTAVDPGYRVVRSPQLTLLVCCALLAGILLGISVYFVVRWRTAGVLEDRGVHTRAVVQSTEAERATVSFDTTDGPKTVTIDRLGPTLCPETDALHRFRGCADIPNGVAFDLVFDPHDPTVAQPADTLSSSSWLTSAVISIVLGLVLVRLAVGRWRWLQQLRDLRKPDAPLDRMRVRAMHRYSQKARMPFMTRVDLEPLDGTGDALRVVVTAPQGLRDLVEGGEVDVVGEPTPGHAVAIVDAASLAWPTRKARLRKASS